MPRKRLNADRYANRTDLQAGAGQGAAPVAQSAPTQPARAPTGLPYGQHQALVQAQQAVPLPQTPPPPTAAQGFDGAVGAALAAPPPSLVPLTAPSQRPNEPTTAGLGIGAGPGPEVLAHSQQTAKASATYLALYQQTGDDTFRDLANAAFARGQ